MVVPAVSWRPILAHLLAARERDIEAHAVFVDSTALKEKRAGAPEFLRSRNPGRNKAVALAWRYNAAYGLNIAAIPEALTVTKDTQLAATRWRQACRCCSSVVSTTPPPALDVATIIEGLDGRGWWLDSSNAYGNGHILLGNSARPLSRNSTWACSLHLLRIRARSHYRC